MSTKHVGAIARAELDSLSEDLISNYAMYRASLDNREKDLEEERSRISRFYRRVCETLDLIERLDKEESPSLVVDRYLLACLPRPTLEQRREWDEAPNPPIKVDRPAIHADNAVVAERHRAIAETLREASRLAVQRAEAKQYRDRARPSNATPESEFAAGYFQAATDIARVLSEMAGSPHLIQQTLGGWFYVNPSPLTLNVP